MDGAHVSEAAARTGWSPRMLRYLERVGLIVPARTAGGYRRYGLRELNQLSSLGELRRRFHVDLDGTAISGSGRTEARRSCPMTPGPIRHGRSRNRLLQEEQQSGDEQSGACCGCGTSAGHPGVTSRDV